MVLFMKQPDQIMNVAGITCYITDGKVTDVFAKKYSEYFEETILKSNNFDATHFMSSSTVAIRKNKKYTFYKNLYHVENLGFFIDDFKKDNGILIHEELLTHYKGHLFTGLKEYQRFKLTGKSPDSFTLPYPTNQSKIQHERQYSLSEMSFNVYIDTLIFKMISGDFQRYGGNQELNIFDNFFLIPYDMMGTLIDGTHHPIVKNILIGMRDYHG